jgi:ATP-dependent Clp protease adaptor protein ClpS
MLKTRGETKIIFLLPPKVQSGTLSLTMDQTESQNDTGAHTSTLPRVARPSLYKVILLNDDFTPMDFVILILKKFFAKTDGESQRIMLEVHSSGAAIAGIYTFEMAETKIYLVNEFSRRHKYPLKCIMEKDSDPAPSES